MIRQPRICLPLLLALCVATTPSFAQRPGAPGGKRSPYAVDGMLKHPPAISGTMAGATPVAVVVQTKSLTQTIPIDHLTTVVVRGEADQSLIPANASVRAKGVVNEATGVLYASEVLFTRFAAKNGQQNWLKQHLEHNGSVHEKPENELKMRGDEMIVEATTMGTAVGVNPLRIKVQNKVYAIHVSPETKMEMELIVDHPGNFYTSGDRVSVSFQVPKRRDYVPASWIDITRSEPFTSTAFAAPARDRKK